MDAIGFHAQEGRLEEGLGVAEPLIANGDDLIVRQLIALLQGESRRPLLKVQGDLAQLLLDVTHNFPLSCGGEAITMLHEDLHEVSPIRFWPARSRCRMTWERAYLHR